MPLDATALTDALGYCGAGETSADPYLPFVDHAEKPHVMLLKDGSVLGMAHMRGVPFGFLGKQPRDGHMIRHTAFLNAVANSNVEVFEHLVRHDRVPAIPPRPPETSPYAASLLGDWHAHIAPTLRQNDWFLSILVRPRSAPFATMGKKVARAFAGARGGLARLAKGSMDLGSARAKESEIAPLVRQLEDGFRLAAGLLRTVRPRVLGVRENEHGVLFSEIGEALELIRTSKFEEQPLIDPVGTLGAALGANDPIAGRRGFEVRYGPGGTDAHYGVMLGLTQYALRISQDRFDDLLKLDGRLVLTNHIRFFNRAEAQEDIANLRRFMRVDGSEDEEGMRALTDAIAKVATGQTVRGTSRWSLAIHADPTPADEAEAAAARDPRARRGIRAASAMREVDRLVADARTIIASAGLRAAPEGLGNKASHIAQTPGAPRRCQIRPAGVPTDFFASLSTLGGYAQGPDAFRWDGPLFRLPSAGNTPYDHDQAVGDVLHQVVIGPNGSGKTVWIGFCMAALQALVAGGRRPGTQIILDVDGSNEQTVLALGGLYNVIKGGGEESGIVPHRLLNSANVRHMLRSLISGLCRMDGGAPLTADEIAGLREGVAFMMGEMEPHERHLGVVRAFMGFEKDGAGARLERWCRQFDGDLAWVFDGRKHVLDFDLPLAGVDLTGVMEDATVMPPMGMFLLWLASQQMDGRRCVVWCEEAPAYIGREEFEGMGKALALRGRKRNACFIPVAQMPEHLLKTAAGKAIVKQARQIVLLPNEGAEYSDYVDGLGVSAPVYRMVKRGMAELGHRAVAVVRKDGQSGICRFDLSAPGLRKHLAVLSGTTNSVKLMRSIVGKSGGADPMANLNEFWSRLHEAAA